jgi:hypothetical protein
VVRGIGLGGADVVGGDGGAGGGRATTLKPADAFAATRAGGTDCPSGPTVVVWSSAEAVAEL